MPTGEHLSDHRPAVGGPVCEHLFVRTWNFSVTEYDPNKPCVIVSIRRGLTVELADEIPFMDWAHDRWPSPKYSVEPDPWELSTNLRIAR